GRAGRVQSHIPTLGGEERPPATRGQRTAERRASLSQNCDKSVTIPPQPSRRDEARNCTTLTARRRLTATGRPGRLPAVEAEPETAHTYRNPEHPVEQRAEEVGRPGPGCGDRKRRRATARW